MICYVLKQCSSQNVFDVKKKVIFMEKGFYHEGGVSKDKCEQCSKNIEIGDIFNKTEINYDFTSIQLN